jgi:anti-anti-sigma regulatory factor
MDRVRPNPWTVWLVFHGQADLASRATLHELLAASADAPDVRSLHLHLADLAFADVHAVTRLAALAAGLRGPERAVVTCDPTPELRRIAAVLDLTVVLGLA